MSSRSLREYESCYKSCLQEVIYIMCRSLSRNVIINLDTTVYKEINQRFLDNYKEFERYKDENKDDYLFEIKEHSYYIDDLNVSDFLDLALKISKEIYSVLLSEVKLYDVSDFSLNTYSIVEKFYKKLNHKNELGINLDINYLKDDSEDIRKYIENIRNKNDCEYIHYTNLGPSITFNLFNLFYEDFTDNLIRITLDLIQTDLLLKDTVKLNNKLNVYLHDYSLSVLGVRLENSTITNNQKHILSSVNQYFNKILTIDEFKSKVDSIVNIIKNDYFSDEALNNVLTKIVDFIMDSNLLNKKGLEKFVINIQVEDFLSNENLDVNGVTFNYSEIYHSYIESLIKRAKDKASVLIEERKNQEEFKKAQSEDTKLKDKNASTAGNEVNKSLLDSENDLSDKVRMFKLFTHSIGDIANKVLNYLAMLADNNLDSGKKDEIIAILSANTNVKKTKKEDGSTYTVNYLKVFLSKEFLSNYFSYLNRKLKDDLDNGVESHLVSQGLNHLNDLLSSSSVNSAISYTISTMASCTACEIKDISSKFKDIITDFENLKYFNESRTDYKFKRKPVQKLVFESGDDEDRRTDEEKQADEEMFKRAREEFDKKVEQYGGLEKYNEYIRRLNEHKKLKNVLTLSGLDIEESENCRDKDDYFECESDIRSVLDDIMDYYKSMFDLCIKMGKFSGIYIFEDTNSTSESTEFGVMEVVSSESGESRLRTINKKGSSLLKWIRYDYEYPLKSINGGIKVARHNQVPSLENILVNGYNYYPAFIARYALGFVNKTKVKTFKEFMTKVRNDVENRLYSIYKDKVIIDDKEYLGSDLFDASSEDRVRLIGAFVNSIIFLTGQSNNGFDTAQLRCVSSYPHSNELAKYYTEFSTTGTKTSGLSDAAQVNYLNVNNANARNIIDITYIKDKETFYNEVSWAYQELGKVYSTGEIPNVAKNGKVVIGQELSGQLVEFSLGENNQFTTSIYAGSRSGKGVTTLSILAAIMASRIPVCYLDCKPDMVNCFWDMEQRVSNFGLSGRTYAFDMNAGTPRLDYTGMKSLSKLIDKKSGLYDTSVAESLLILKQLQLICVTGMYIQNHMKGNTTVWVFDEINNMLNKLKNGFQIIVSCAKKGSESDKATALTLYDFWRRVQASITRGFTDTWGQCGYKFICIGQKPGDIMSSDLKIGWKDLKDANGSDGGLVLNIIANADVNKYILGRGLNINGGFGTKAFHNDPLVSKEEKNALEQNRYFIIRDCKQVKSDKAVKGVKIDDTAVLFKPFLTLNFDDVTQGCWINGVGNKYYRVKSEKGSSDYIKELSEYKMSLNAEYGANTTLTPDVLNSADGKGVVDEGTGFYGLIKMYLGGDDKSVLETVIKPYLFIDSILRKMNIIGESSMFGYQSVEEYLYDFSEKGMAITSYDEWNDYCKAYNAGNISETSSNSNEISSNYSIPDENNATPNSSNSQEINSDSSSLSSEEMKQQAEMLEKEQAQILREQREAEQLADNLRKKEEDEIRRQEQLEARKLEADAKLQESKQKVFESEERKISLDVLHRYSVQIDRIYQSLSNIKEHIESVQLKDVAIQKLVLSKETLKSYINKLEFNLSTINNNSFEYNGEVHTFDSLVSQKDLDFISKIKNSLSKLIEDCNSYINKIIEIESLYNNLINGGDESLLNQSYEKTCKMGKIEHDNNFTYDLFDELENQRTFSSEAKKELAQVSQNYDILDNEINDSNNNIEAIRKEVESANQRTNEANANLNNIEAIRKEVESANQRTNDSNNENFGNHQNDNNASNQDSQFNASVFRKTVNANSQVSMVKGMEEYASKTDSQGHTSIKEISYVEDIIRYELPYLNERFYRTSRFKFIDKAMVKQNQKDRYKIFIRAVEDSVSWSKVTQLTMTSSEIIINRNEKKINVQALGDNDYNIYEVMDFADLFFNKTKRLHTLRLDDEVSEIIVAECGGAIYETLFNTTPSLQRIFIGKLEINKHNRTASMEMALKAEVEKAEAKSRAKDAMAESLFASGKVNQTSENMAIAKRITRRAEKSGRKTQTNKGLIAAQKLGKMTLPQLALAGVAGVFLGIGSAINLLRSKM